jgi:hypothetical protein
MKTGNTAKAKPRGAIFRTAINAAFVAALTVAGQSLAAQGFQPTDLFRGSVYLAGTAPRELIFTHENDFAVVDGATTLTHTYRNIDGSVATVERVTLKRGSISTYEVDFTNSECGCALRADGDFMVYAFTRGDSKKTSRKPVQKDLVTGPTLNAFIADNWAALGSGDTAYFHFPAMELQQSVRFRMYRNRTSQYTRTGVLVLTMDTASALLRLIVDPVDLVIDERTKRLVEIHGKSLLEREVNGKTENPVVDIYYEYTGGQP